MSDADAPAPPGAATISLEVAARLLMLTPQRVNQLVRKGFIPKAQHGKYTVVGTVHGYIKFLKTDRRGADKSSADAELKKIKGQREQLKLERERADLIPTALAIDIIDEAIGMLRSGLAGVPARISRDMILRGKIEANIDAVLSAVAGKFAERAATLVPAEHADTAAAEDDAGPVGEGEP